MLNYHKITNVTKVKRSSYKKLKEVVLNKIFKLLLKNFNTMKFFSSTSTQHLFFSYKSNIFTL